MKRIPSFIIMLLVWLPIAVDAAPLNKFGTMQDIPVQQVVPAPQQQLTIAPFQQQQQALPDRAAQQPVAVEPVTPQKKETIVLTEVEKLLSRLPADKLQEWQTKFEAKRQAAQDEGKTKVVDYYDRLIALCKKLAGEGNQP